MALVNVANMVVLDNPAPFGNPLQFEITFECLQSLQDDLEWKVVYVGSAENSTHDQTLDEILVGPVPVGINKFILQADAPDPSTIPSMDILGVTVILVTCSYREEEFVRVGYYVNNEYTTEEMDMGQEGEGEVGAPPTPPTPPTPLDMTKVVRTILADKPRVTRFPINWGDLTKEQEQLQQQQQIQQADEPMVTEEEDENDGKFIVDAPQDVTESMVMTE